MRMRVLTDVEDLHDFVLLERRVGPLKLAAAGANVCAHNERMEDRESETSSCGLGSNWQDCANVSLTAEGHELGSLRHDRRALIERIDAQRSEQHTIVGRFELRFQARQSRGATVDDFESLGVVAHETEQNPGRDRERGR